MSYLVQAVYENGVLKPLEKLALGEHQQVWVTVEPNNTASDGPKQDRADPYNAVLAATGICDLEEHSDRGPASLEGEIGQARDSPSVVVPITTLAPEPFDLLREIPVVVQPTDDGYLATFFDANIGMTGDTQEEAVSSLRLLLVDVFDELEKEEAQLGPYPARQLAVLRGFMRRRS